MKNIQQNAESEISVMLKIKPKNDNLFFITFRSLNAIATFIKEKIGTKIINKIETKSASSYCIILYAVTLTGYKPM